MDVRLILSIASGLTAPRRQRRAALASVVAGLLVLLGCSSGHGLTPQPTQGASGTTLLLRWTVPKQSAIAGYRVYRGSSSHKYGPPLDVGALGTATVDGVVYCLYPNVPPGRSYFAVTTYDGAHVESEYSNEKVIDVTRVTPPRADAGADRTGKVGDVVTLSAAPDAGASYLWEQTAGPHVKLSSRTESSTQFTAGKAGTYRFALIAYDAQGVAARAEVNVVLK